MSGVNKQQPPHKRHRQMEADEEFFLEVACRNMLKRSDSIPTLIRRFRSKFGVSPKVCADVWNLVDPDEYPELPENETDRAEHMLWGLMLLKSYDTEEELADKAGKVDEQTFRKWAWKWAEKIDSLELDVINFEDRKIGDTGNDCLLSVDGADFLMWNCGRNFYSHKYKKSGLRYEVGLSIKTGEICWINGPYPAGLWPDISIFRNCLMSFLEEGERVEADDGYIGEAPKWVKCPASFANDKSRLDLQQRVRNRHETVNKRMKHFGCLNKRFRHSTTQHSICFRAVAVLTQLSIKNLEPLFEVEYDDDDDDLSM